MSCSWYPDRFEFHVDNPGHGELLFRHENGDWVTLAGPALGELLAAVTARALGGGDWTYSKVGYVSIDEARGLLPAMQRAVVLATAGTDRFERTFVDEDEAPQEPLCVNCNEGSPYHQEVTISARCTEHGHQPFGYAASTSWDAAGRRHARDVDWWNTRQRLRELGIPGR